ncbi:MAG: hypothetical protein RLZ98_1849 [Pseudomonadota bacterium]|jgi:hypothetical protein
MDQLKLIALDEEDLKVISAHLQDAVVRCADIGYVPQGKRFAMFVRRFNWESAHASNPETVQNKGPFERRLAAVRMERVLAVRYKGMRPGGGDQVLNLLALEFTGGEAPGGTLTLRFSGEAAMQLDVECIEVEISDLGAAWETRNRPEHPE